MDFRIGNRRDIFQIQIEDECHDNEGECDEPMEKPPIITPGSLESIKISTV